MIIGDWNAHIEKWLPKKTNSAGKRMAQFMEQNNLICLDPTEIGTFVH